MILLWDVDSGLAQIDKFLHSNDNHVVAGALLGVGIVNCGIRNDCDPVCLFSNEQCRSYNIIVLLLVTYSRLNLSLYYHYSVFLPYATHYPLQALALLGDFIEKDDTIIRIGAILGLGIAYAGTNKDEVDFL